MTDKTLNLRISADDSGLEATLRDSTGNLRTFKTAVDETNASTVAGNQRVASSFDQLGARAKASAVSVVAGLRDEASAVGALIGQIDSTAGRLGKLDSQLAQLKAFKSSGAISGEDFAAYAAKIEVARAALGNADKATHSFSLGTSQARVEIGRLIKDMATGQTDRFAQSFTTLTAQTGLLSSAFSFLLSPIGLTVAAVGLLAAAYVGAENEGSRLNQSIISTGNFAGTTVQQIQQLGTQLGAQNGKISESREALQLLVASGNVTGDMLKTMAKGVVDFATVTGKSIPESVKEFEKLNKEPAAAAAELNQQYNFLTISIYDQIRAAEKNGDTQEATAIAQRALAAEEATRATQIQENLGYIERSWNGVKQAAKDAWDAMLNIGRDQTLDQQLAEARGKINQAQADIEAARYAGAPMDSGAIQNLMAQAQKWVNIEGDLLNKIQQNKGASNEASAAAQANYAEEQKAAIAAQADLDRMTASADKDAAAQQKIAKAASDLYAIYKAGGALPKGISFDGAMADVPVGPGWEKLQAEILSTTKSYRAFESELAKVPGAINAIDEIYQASQQQQGALTAETNRYNHEIDALDAKVKILIDTHKLSVAEAYKVGDAYDYLDAKHQKQIALLEYENQLRKENGSAIEQLFAHLDQENNLIGLNDEARAKLEAEMRAQHEIQQALLSDAQKGITYSPQEIDAMYARGRATADLNVHLKEQAELNKQVWQEEASIVRGAGGEMADDIGKFFTGTLDKGKSFGQDMVDIFKEMVAKMIAQLAMLSLVNPFMNSVFGGMLGNSPTLANAGGSIFGSLFGGVSGGSAGVSDIAANASGGGFSLFSPSTWLTAGKTIFDGFSNGFSNIGTSIGTFVNGPAGTLPYSPAGAGSYADELGFVPNYEGGGAFPGGGATGASYGGYGSGLGEAIGGAAALYAAYNAYKSTGGGAMGALAGATYGVGTFVAGGAIAGGLAGTGAIAGGTAAAGSLGLAAIPVVGWVALAAMAINMISGGKLFGTAGKPIGGGQTETIGPDGATVTAEMTTKGQKAFFGGAYYKQHSLDVDPAAQKAADDFYDALKHGTADFAAQFGATAGALVGGSFVQNFDKKGKPTTTSDTVLGVTYTGETQEQFAERLQADNFLAVLDTMGIGASKFAESAQGDADALFKLVQDMASTTQAVQADIKHNLSLLGEDHSIADVMAEVFKLNAGGESLAQTYANLQISTQALSNDLKLANDATGLTGAALVEFANDAAKAAGGAQALNDLIQKFDAAFYTSGQQAAINLAQMRKNVTEEFSAIGEDPTESLSKFKQDFDAIRDTLSPEQLVAWYQAGVDLAAFNTQMQTAAGNYAQFIDQFKTDSLTNFEKAMVGLGLSITDNIAKANDLAIANGQSGASAADIGAIIASSVQQGVAALRQLQSETATLAGQLFGSTLDQLKAQEAEFEKTGFIDFDRTKKISDLENQQSAQQQLQQAVGLIGNFGQIGAITGQTLGQLAEEFNVPLDKLASLLGTDGEGLAKDFAQQEDAARAALDTAHNTEYTNHLLADILADSQGKPLPYSTSQLAEDATGKPVVQVAAPGDKPGARLFEPPTTAQSVAAAPGSSGNAQPANTSEANAAVAQIPVTLQQGNDKLIQALNGMVRELGSMRQTMTRFGMARMP